MAHACDPSAWKAEGLGVQGHPQLRGVLEASLSLWELVARPEAKEKQRQPPLACPCLPGHAHTENSLCGYGPPFFL